MSHTWKPYQTITGDAERVTEHDPVHALARAVIDRAYRDSRGMLNDTRYQRLDVISCLIQDGTDFFRDGRFEYWCDVLSIDDPAGLLDEMKRIGRDSRGW